MTVKDVLDRVTTLYNDSEYVRVGKEGYLRFLDDAINQICLVRPDAHVKTEIIDLVAGNRQSMPSDAYTLIDIYRNENGAPITQTERNNLDYFTDWYAGAPTSEIKEFIYDVRSPKSFWVSPASDGTSRIEMTYTYRPTKYAGSSLPFEDTLKLDIELEDVFTGAVVNYMLFLLYSTDSSSTMDAQFAGSYLNKFLQDLGTEFTSTTSMVPKPQETVVGVTANA